MRKPKIELYKDRTDRWRWRRRAANGEITETAQAYATKANARLGAKRRASAMARPCAIVVV